MEIKLGAYSKVSIILLYITVLSGCGHFAKSSNIDDKENQKSILVFGYVDDSEAPYTMRWGEIKQVRPAVDEPYKELRSNRKGLFYLENLPVGSYELIELAGIDKGLLSRDEWATSFVHKSGERGFERLRLRSKKQGVYFLGSYKIDMVKRGGLLGYDRYAVIPTNKPSEKELLKRLLVHAKDTKWAKIIKQRIKRLK